jgi:hypothetical protein
VREVVDGQQRLRTILSFVKDGFSVSGRQNPTYGGLLFSQLPEEVQAQVLAYEMSVDLLINLPDSEILDIFSRLNSYAVVLNEQERINADHFGPFKTLCDKIGHKYYKYWTDQGILTARQIMRMLEVNLVADIFIAFLEGIKSKKQVKKFYDLYESNFDYSGDELEQQFDQVISLIANLYPEGLSDTEFKRLHIFYSLVTAIAHREFGLPNMEQAMRGTKTSAETLRNRLERIEQLFCEPDLAKLNKDEQQFLTDARRATTDEPVRARRTAFLLKLLAA